MKLLYIAGPYRAATAAGIQTNIRAAETAGGSIILSCPNVLPVVPHSIGARYGHLREDDAFWLASTLRLMERCDAVYMVPGWQASAGSVAERERALALGLPVFTTIDAVVRWATPVTEARLAPGNPEADTEGALPPADP